MLLRSPFKCLMRENRSLSMDLIWEEQCLPLLTMALGLFIINTLSRSSSRPVLRCAVCVSTRFRRELSSFFNYLLCGGIITCQAAAPGGQQTDEAPGQLGCAWGLLAGGRWETRPCSQHGAPSALKGVLFQLKKKKRKFRAFHLAFVPRNMSLTNTPHYGFP